MLHLIIRKNILICLISYPSIFLFFTLSLSYVILRGFVIFTFYKLKLYLIKREHNFLHLHKIAAKNAVGPSRFIIYIFFVGCKIEPRV